MIFSDNIEVKNSKQNFLPFKRRKLFWEHCGEDDILMPRGNGRMDPVLKLYAGCRVMLPTNTNVERGQANGMQASIEWIVLKPRQEIHYVYLDNHVPIMAVFASQVAYIELRHYNSLINPAVFQIKPKTHSFKARIPKPMILHIHPKNTTELIDMRATQLPILLNNATTGHKLQGSGVNLLFVHNWSYVTNWVYVMLSHVKTLNGLFLRKPLDNDPSRYAVPQSYKRMIQQFQQFIPTSFTNANYIDIAEGPCIDSIQ